MVPLPDCAEVREVERARRARRALGCKNEGILIVIANMDVQVECFGREYV